MLLQKFLQKFNKSLSKNSSLGQVETETES